MHKMLKILVLGLALFFGQFTAFASSSYLPASILKLGDIYGHHLLIAEKSTHTLYLFANNQGMPKLLKKFDVATGKRPGDKFLQGDHRTPEGIYQFTDFLNHQDLIKRHGIEQGSIYGVGAFVMDYPNPVDLLNGKTGGGIWLHSTNDEPRIDKGLDSRGCIVSTNADLIELSKYLELNKSHIIVVQDLKYLTKNSWELKREKLNNTLESWLTSWRELDINKYLSHYDQDFFYDPVRGNYNQFELHKQKIFKNTKKPEIEVIDLNLFQTGEYAVATFVQKYKSNVVEDIGKKTLYLKKNDSYEWKIVAEVWSKSGIPKQPLDYNLLSFTPKLRFFETRDPAQILPIKSRQTDRP